MSDRYSFQTQFDPPIHKGSVIQYYPERKSGRIMTNTEELQLVNISGYGDLLQKSIHWKFRKILCKIHLKRL